MRIGQSIWSREDFNLNNPTNSLLFSTTTSSSSKSIVKFQSDTDICQDSELYEQGIIFPHGNLINSSKKLFANKIVRNRIYEQHQHALNDGTFKTIYLFRATKIPVDDSGPFWPMAFPIKHPSPTFLSLKQYENPSRNKEYYHDILGSNFQTQQTFDNQPAIQKYTDQFKHSIIVYDMDKSPRYQQPKQNESEQMCPPLIFESRFEGGNLRQVKRM
jgi:hypothetical protein